MYERGIFMKNLRKILSVVLCVVMVLSMSLTPVMAADNDIMFDLKSLGILGGFGFEDHLDSNITRGEFAQLVVNMMNHKEIAMTMETASYFTDVADSPYKGAINLLYKDEIVSGTGYGTFEPNRNVRYSEACKMLVKALGYHVIVSDTSLGSYTFLAGTIGVTENVDSSKEYITVKDMLVMVDNCLDIGRMIPMYYNTDLAPSYVVDEDDTFRSKFEKPAPEGTVKMEGIVTADASSYIEGERAILKASQLEIGGKVFEFDGIAPLGYVGQNVYFYVTVDSDGNYGNVVSIIPTNENTITQLNGVDVASYSNTEIKYYINENKTADLEMNLRTKWIYNGVPGAYCLENVDFDGNVQLVVIDNNDDEICDVVFVYEYVDAIVDTVDAENKYIIFEAGNYYRNEKSMSLDEEEENIAVSYFDAEGNPTTLEAIKEGSVLSIAKSNNGKKYRIVISDLGGTALVEGKDGDYITLGTTEYKALGIETAAVKIGRNYNYKVNFLGRLIYIDEVIVSSNYAYMYQLSTVRGLATPKVKLIIPERITSKVIEGEYDATTNTMLSSSTNLYMRNSNLLVYNLASKVTLEYWTTDDKGNEILAREKVNATSDKVRMMLNKPVSFEVDADNSIIKLADVKFGSGGGVRYMYNSSERTFYKSANAAPFGIDENTSYAVVVPTNDASEDDILNYIQEFMHGNSYIVNSYDLDEETHIAKLLVYEANMISGVSGDLAANRARVGMVTKCIKAYDKETGTETIKVTMLTKGGQKSVCEQTFTVSPLIANAESFTSINKGDLITYSLDGFDRLDGFSMKKKFESYFDGSTGVVTAEFTVCGTVTDIDYDEISNVKGMWADNVTFENVDGLYTYELYHSSSLSPTVYILNSANREAELGKVADIRYGDRILVFANAGDAYAVVIYR